MTSAPPPDERSTPTGADPGSQAQTGGPPWPQQGAPTAQQQWPQPGQQWPQQPAQQPELVGAGVAGSATGPGYPPSTGAYPQQAGYQYTQPQLTGQFGYSYGEMPQYPVPQFPPPQRPPERGIPAWVWVIASVLVVAVVTVFALPAFLDDDPAPGPNPTVDPTDGFGQPNSSPAGTFTGEHMVETINAALAARDRETFFRFVEGEALAPLTLWWDNMDVLQWTVGAFSIAPGQLDGYENDLIELRVTLGAGTAGTPVIPTSSDHPDAGLTYAPSNVYVASIRVTDDGASGVISTWAPYGTAAPWDLEPLYAVVTESSVMAGYADEQELIDRVAPMGDEAATWVIETWRASTGVANAEQFTTFISEDPDRFNDWFIGETSGWVGDRAGTMFPQRRPYPSEGIVASVAVGGPRTNAGGILTVGPNAILYGDEEVLNTIVHEFVHAIHTTNVPEESWPGSPVMEGWATYNESLFRGEGEFAQVGTYVGTAVRRCVNEDAFDGTFPTQDDFVPVETVHCAYMLSATMYAYAASLGADVYEAADYALEEGLSLPEAVVAIGGPVIDEAGWSAWLEASYGA